MRRLSLTLWLSLACAAAPDDTSVDDVMSIDWLVDSSDEIFLVRFLSEEILDRNPAGVVQVREALKGRAPASDFSPANLRTALPTPAKGEEWLLFTRRAGPAAPLITFRGVNLSQLAKHYRSAAITGYGVPALSRISVMELVRRRIKRDRPLPPFCNRVVVDMLARRNRELFPPQYRLGNNKPAPTAFRGGFMKRINCSFWDQAGPHDLDTILGRALVPADPEYRGHLMDRTRAGSRDSLFALLNYPDPRTDDMLHSLFNSQPAAKGPIRFVYRTNDIEQVLRLREFQQQSLLPASRPLVGAWRLLGKRETVDLQLRPDFTCSVAISGLVDGVRAPWQKPRYEGLWKVQHGRFHLLRTHALGADWGKNKRQFFAPKRVLKVSEKEVQLEDGPPMVRAVVPANGGAAPRPKLPAGRLPVARPAEPAGR